MSKTTANHNQKISSYFAVLCIMEDLIGSADAESDAATVAARARAVPQLTALACSMGRDWCENEIVPYLQRVAREDERSVSVAATEQIASLCETRYFEQSVELQNALLLQVGVDFLASSHAEVRQAAMEAVRKACVVISYQNYVQNNQQQLQQSAEGAEIETSTLPRSTIATEACKILQYVVQGLIQTGFPAALSSALQLLAPSQVDLTGYRCNMQLRPEDTLLNPLLLCAASVVVSIHNSTAAEVMDAQRREQIRAEFHKMLTLLLSPPPPPPPPSSPAADPDDEDLVAALTRYPSILAHLRFEAAICGGTGRVVLVDQALMSLLRDLLTGFFFASSSPFVSRHHHHHHPQFLQHLHSACSIVLDHLIGNVFSAACPSAVFLDTALPQLCDCLRALSGADAYAHNNNNNNNNSGNPNNKSASSSLLLPIAAKLHQLCVRCLSDWAAPSSCEDWAVRFEIAKYAPQLFEGLLLPSSSVPRQETRTMQQQSALDREKQQLALDFLERILPRLVNDEEVEVSTAAAGSLPKLMLIAEKRMMLSAAAFSAPPLPARLSDVFDREKLAAPSVQEAVATAFGEAVRGESISSSSNKHGQSLPATAATSQLATTAHNTLCEMLTSCEDDAVRAQIIESLLWSTAVPHHPSRNNNANNNNTLYGSSGNKSSSAGAVMSPALEASLRSSISSLLCDTAATRWRTRDLLAASLSKMMLHLLLLVAPSPHALAASSSSLLRQQPQQSQTPSLLLLPVSQLHRIVLHHPGCFEFVVEPFVRLLLDRFYQVRTTALSAILDPRLTRAHREPLWHWVTSLMGQHSNYNNNNGNMNGSPQAWPSMGHYQTRIARLIVAVVCASESSALHVLEEAARDKVPNVRRAAAQALSQGCGKHVPPVVVVVEHENRNSGADSNNGGSGGSMNRDMLPGRELIQGFAFSWSAAASIGSNHLSSGNDNRGEVPAARRVLLLLEALVGDDEADVRESAAAGLARCGW